MKNPKETSGMNSDQGCLTETENPNGTYVFVDAIGDTTIRPMRSPVLRQTRPDDTQSLARSQGDERP